MRCLTTAVVNAAAAVVVVFLTTVVMATTTDQTLRYNVSEEVDPGTVVGDFKRDYYASKRAADGYDLSALRFNFRSPSTYFRIDGLTGVIRTARRIDREQLCGRKTQPCDVSEQVVDVIVTPTDRFVIVKVRIIVIDINDHAPTFPVDEMALDVWDNSPLGALYSIPYADDADSGILGVQGYSLEGARGKFDLKVTDMLDGSHDVRLQLRERLNAGVQRVHNLTVVARDGGIPSRSGTLVVRVTLRSVADVRPKFDGVYTASVVENCPLGRWVTQVQATSAGNQQIVYGLVDDNRPEAAAMTSGRKLFRIDPRSGSVYVSGSIDYETDREFHVTVSAAVNGRPALMAVTSLTIEVVDVNDNAPEIAVNTLLRSGRGQVTENAPNGTFVAHVIVTDPDSGDNSWTACLTNSALFLLEGLSATEYKLTTTVTFDREEEIQHKVKVVCHDFGTPSLTSSVPLPVDVIDENDNDPKFSRSEYTVTDPEDVAPDSVLLRVSAFDADDGANARLSYSIAPLAPPPGAAAAAAAIAIDDVTGDVRAIAPLDYESGAQYRFLVTAVDAGMPRRSGSATLTLNLIDCNDGVPTFSSSSSSSFRSGYLFRALVDRPPGSVVGRVEATDTDATDVHRNVTYSLEGLRDGASVPFQVDPLTGWIRSGRVLASGEVYGFLVRASNSLSPVPLTGVANVTVVANRTLPSFLFPTPDNHTVTLNLDSVKVGDVIAEVRVEQHDDDLLRYGLEKNGDARFFRLEERTGSLLLVKEPLPVQTLYRLTLTISVDPDVEFKVTGRLDVKVTASSSALIGQPSWIGTRQKLMTLVIGVIVGVIVIAVVIVITVVVFLRLRRAKARRGEYNCRYEANRPRCRVKVHDSDVMSDYSINQNGVLINNSLKQKVTSAKKKEVTFALDDVDDDVAEEDKMLDIYKESQNQFIYNKSSAKCSSDALLNSPEDNDSIGSDSGKGASEEGDSSAPGHRYAPRAAHHAPHSHSDQQGSAKATSPQSSASNCGSSKVTRVTAAPPLQPPNTRIPPPPPRPLDRESESTAIPNLVAMVTFKGCATPPPSYSPARQTNPQHSSAPGEYSCGDHRHSPGGASNNASRQSDDAHFVEFATDV